MGKIRWGHGSLCVGICVALLSVYLAAVLTSAEDATRVSPQMLDTGFSLGSLTFVRIPEGVQPLPHIQGGFADYDGPQSNFELPEFCMATRVLGTMDVPEVCQDLTIGHRQFKGKLMLDDYEVALLTNRLNRDYIPTRDGQPVNGRYCIATAALFIRAVFMGDRCECKIPDDGVFSAIRSLRLADRFSQDLNWTGEPQPGELTPSCSTGRLERLIATSTCIGWPAVGDKSWYLDLIKERRHSAQFRYGSPMNLSVLPCTVVLCFVLDKKE